MRNGFYILLLFMLVSVNAHFIDDQIYVCHSYSSLSDLISLSFDEEHKRLLAATSSSIGDIDLKTLKDQDTFSTIFGIDDRQINSIKVFYYESKKKTLVICASSHHGSCYRFSSNFNYLRFFSNNPFMVSSNPSHKIFSQIVSYSSRFSPDYLVLSNPPNPENLPFIASYQLNNISYFKPSFSINFVPHLDSSKFSIGGLFEHETMVYYVINRPEMKDSPAKSFILQTCVDHDSSNQVIVEVPFHCLRGGSQVPYNFVVSVTLTQIGDKLAKSLKLIGSEKVVFFLVKESEASPSSSLCFLPISSIVDHFSKKFSDCRNNLDGSFSDKYLQNPIVSCHHFGPRAREAMCDSNQPFTIMSNSVLSNSLTSDSFYPLDLQGASSILATEANDYNVVFVSSTSGITELKIPSLIPPETLEKKVDLNQLPFVFKTISVPGNIISMTTISQDAILLLRDDSICKLKKSMCNYTTCDPCINDPFCGWCLNSQKCTSLSNCPSDVPGLWSSDSCPSLTAEGSKVITKLELNSKSLHLTASNMTLTNFNQLKCHAATDSASSSFQQSVEATFSNSPAPNIINLICQPFFFRSLQFDNKNYIEMTLSLIVDGLNFSATSIKIYECQNFHSCNECSQLSHEFPCGWCVSSFTCVSMETKCDGKALVPIPANSCPSLNHKISPYFHSNSPFVFNFSSSNLKPSFEPYHCEFTSPDSSHLFVPAKVEEDGLVTCQSTKLSHKKNSLYSKIIVNLYTNNKKHKVDNLHNVSLTLYDCNYLADSCGECVNLDPNFRCNWCVKDEKNNHCSLISSCENPLHSSEPCPDPQIISIQPEGGPLSGGTRLSILGKNLGRKSNDVEVLLGNQKCHMIHESYMSPSRVVCSTEKVKEEKKAEIKINIKNKYFSRSKREFHFKDFIITKITPESGTKCGGKEVAILGSNLNYGSEAYVKFDNHEATVLSRNSSHIIVLTPPVSKVSRFEIWVEIDKVLRRGLYFQIKENPVITSFFPSNSLQSGGREITVKGTNLEEVGSAYMVVMVNGINHTSDCHYDSPNLNCTTPSVLDSVNSLEMENPYLAVHFKMDYCFYPEINSTSLIFVIKYYKEPEFLPFLKPFHISDLVKNIPIKTKNSEWLTVFEGDMQVFVDKSECNNVDFDRENEDLTFKPISCSNKSPGSKEVKVRINNFEKNVGQVIFPGQSKKGLIFGIIFGILLFLIFLILLFLLFLWWTRGRKRKNSRVINRPPGVGLLNGADSSISKGNIQKTLENSYNQPNESLPLMHTNLYNESNTNSYLSDEQYLNAMLERIGDENFKNAAKEVYIARERVELGKQLGKGHFAKVHAATLRDEDMRNPQMVAVKSIDDPDMDQKMIDEFVREGVKMKEFNHPHVLSLIGLCLGYKKDPMVVMPFMANGDLRSFVKDKKRSFTARQLLQLAQQVAEGMSYLASLNLIHRDLAARNCMIDDQTQVKVADFGLSHQLHDSEYYSSKNRKAKLPIKWMALESLENYVFTAKSDVWSFGVLLWELMTRGVTPYPDVDVFETRNFLSSGRRLYKPKFCPDNVYGIMSECWQELPERRPTFTDLVNRIEILLNPPKQKNHEDPQSSSGQREPTYINVERKENIQDYLKPISSPQDDEVSKEIIESEGGKFSISDEGSEVRGGKHKKRSMLNEASV